MICKKSSASVVLMLSGLNSISAMEGNMEVNNEKNKNIIENDSAGYKFFDKIFKNTICPMPSKRLLESDHYYQNYTQDFNDTIMQDPDDTIVQYLNKSDTSNSKELEKSLSNATYKLKRLIKNTDKNTEKPQNIQKETTNNNYENPNTIEIEEDNTCIKSSTDKNLETTKKIKNRTKEKVDSSNFPDECFDIINHANEVPQTNQGEKELLNKKRKRK